MQKIDADFESLAYQNVISSGEYLLGTSKEIDQKTEQAVLKKLAYAHYFTKNYEKAEEYFKKSLNGKSDLNQDAEVLLRYAQVLSANGKRAEAAEAWKAYSTLKESKVAAEDFAYIQRNPEPLNRNNSSYSIEYLPLNSTASEFSPMIYGDGLIFVSGRPKYNGVKRIFEWDDSPFLDLYHIEDREELNQLNTTTLSGAGRADKRSKALGSDFYTPETANDGPTLSYMATTSAWEQPSIEARQVSRKLNSVYHEGPADFFNNEQSIIFTRNGIGKLKYENEDGLNRVHLYIADKEGKDWTNLRAFPYNSGEYSTGHPAFSVLEDILFFVSDMPGGFGGTDLYFSVYKDGLWQKPVNAGSQINSAGNEMFPFIDDNNQLYFASDGHPGMGGLDLFSVPLAMNGKPEGRIHNLGAPLNSKYDDFGLVAQANFTSGYFSSNRKNGTADDDIYSFTRTGTMYGCKNVEILASNNGSGKPFVGLEFKYYEINTPQISWSGQLDESGKAEVCLEAEKEFYFEFDENKVDYKKIFFSTHNLSDIRPSQLVVELKPKEVERQQEKIEEVVPKVMARITDTRFENYYAGEIRGNNDEPVRDVKVRFINKCTGEVKEAVTRSDGKYAFLRDKECDYEFIAMKSGFATTYEFIPGEEPKKGLLAEVVSNVMPSSTKKEVVTSSNSSFFDPKVFRVGDVVQMDKIYYSKEEYALSAQASENLDQLASVLNRYPDMVIEVISHTDSRGSAKDNLIMSQKRSEEVKSYLMSKGISGSRVKAIGKGEASPVNQCVDGVQCTEAEYRRNRRTEFRILQIERI
ncbi:OmpA family protein [Jiulongibacter sp. NS-SX5]|uniref:OmpA family protein n=1 Tax=Jiulongibacter sp. NS-SX5 TaxID=3463854 RepID=UPI004058CC38